MKSGLLYEPRKILSWVRPLRSGPTGSLPSLWKTAAKRVSPSTFSSMTMSALFSPACGRAFGWLSILATSAGRAAFAASSTGSPVNG